ncbi:MAG: class I SAM-dependent methyltransferase [Cyanobacteria bacterium P01_A01_bin.17]
MTAAPGMASRIVNGLLAIDPVAKFAKHNARNMMIKRAESIGVHWLKESAALQARGSEVWEAERQALSQDIEYPDYYLTSFHAYESGNLSWDAATEVESAARAVHAKIWPELEAQGDAHLRQTYHDLLRQHLETDPQAILDVGCGAGMSTISLQAIYPDAQMTGLDLSDYFLAIATYRTPRQSIQWLHRPAEETQLPDQSFDLVSICLVVHELPQEATRKILQEARRLLRPQGHLAIMDMNPQAEFVQRLPPYVLTLLKSTEPYLDDYFSLDIEQAVQESGFLPPKIFVNSPRHRTLIAQIQG